MTTKQLIEKLKPAPDCLKSVALRGKLLKESTAHDFFEPKPKRGRPRKPTNSEILVKTLMLDSVRAELYKDGHVELDNDNGCDECCGNEISFTKEQWEKLRTL